MTNNPDRSFPFTRVSSPAGRKGKILSVLLAAAGAMTAAHAAQSSKPADPTATIACFGPDMALSAELGTGDTVRLYAEVLNFGEATEAPKGSVVFMVDGSLVGPAAGVALQPGRDPRTGQPAGVASESSTLHLSYGTHTVKVRYIPEGHFLASQSAASGNLKVESAARLAGAGGSAQPAFEPGKEFKNPVTATLNEPVSERFWLGAGEDFTWFSNGDSHPLIIDGNATIFPEVTGIDKVKTSPGFKGIQSFNQILHPLSLGNSTETLFGHSLDTGYHNQQQAELGFWLNPEETKGIEASGFLTESAETSYTTPTFNTVGIPFLDFGSGRQDTFIVSQPFTTFSSNTFINTTPAVFVHLFTDTVSTQTAGHASATYSDRMWGTGLKYRQELPTIAGLDEDSFTAGFNYFNFGETLGIDSETSTLTTDSRIYDKALGLPHHPTFTDIFKSRASISDSFETHNEFYGLQGGLRGKYQWGRLWASGEANLAIGLMNETLNIHGRTKATETTTTVPLKQIKLAGIPLNVAKGAPVTTTTRIDSHYGLFAQPENSGSQSQQAFALMPSVSLKVGYDITKNLTVFAGYYFFYVSNVLRPADQVNEKGITTSSLYGQTAEIGMKVTF